MARSVSPKVGEVEVLDRRNLRAKVFRDGKQFRCVHSVRPIHWRDSTGWVEVDDTPTTVDGRNWTTPSTPYVLNWDSESVTLTYQSKKGGDVTVRLAALDGLPPNKAEAATLVGQDIVCTVAPELDIRLRVRSHGVEIYKIIHGPSAPTSLTWDILEGDLSNIRFEPMNTVGFDNYTKEDSLRQLSGDLLNRQRKVEIEHTATTPELVDGKKSYQVTETLTGKTRFIDPITKARTWVDEIAYPVEIDVTVSESVVANNDDGRGLNPAYWNQASTSLNVAGSYAAAWRFQTVNVPQGQVLDSATLTVNVTSRGNTGSAPLSGEDVDDAASWANLSANSPLTMTATTANTSWDVPATTGIKQIDVTSAVQEVIDRGGWVANNDLRLGFTSLASIGTGYAEFEDYSAAGTAEGELEIIYTEAGTKPLFRGQA